MYFTAFQDIYELGMRFGGPQLANDMARIYTEEMIELHRGQGIEIWWREQRSCPSVDQYITMLEQSTLFFSLRGIQILTRSGQKLEDFSGSVYGSYNATLTSII